MTSAWSLSIKTVGRSRYHRAAVPVPPPPPPAATATIDNNDVVVKPSNDNESGNINSLNDDNTQSHQPPPSPLHQPHSQHHHHHEHHQQEDPTNNNHVDASESNFTIVVHPDDPLYSLHEKIELITGLKAEEQRLIYRGRIINCTTTTTNNNGSNTTNGGSSGSGRSSDDDGDDGQFTNDRIQQQQQQQQPPQNRQHSFLTTTSSSSSEQQHQHQQQLCVKDITGLGDKQTIHLVPRVNTTTTNNNHHNNSTTANTTATSTEDRDLDDIIGERLFGATSNLNNRGGGGGGASVASLSGEAGLSLLAALLGVSSSSSSSSNPSISAGGDNNGTSANVSTGGGGSSGIGGGSTENGGVVREGVEENGTATIIGLGGLGGLFQGMMGIPMEGFVGGTTTTTTTGAVTGTAADGLLGGGGGRGGESLFRSPPPHVTAAEQPPRDDINYIGPPPQRSTTRTATATTSGAVPPFANTSTTTSTTSSRRVRRNAIHSAAAASSSSSSTSSSSLAAARATAARLTEADIHIPDPGSVEPVRQGLLTLHTLLGNALPSLEDRSRMMMTTTTTTSESSMASGAGEIDGSAVPLLLPPPSLSMESPESHLRSSPLDSHRQWYRGQWLDVLDTVHQWLEATVVDIVLPSEVLPDLVHAENDDDDARAFRENNNRLATSNNRRRMTTRSPPDAVVSANDFEGRRRLLLDLVRCEDDDDDDVDHHRRMVLSHLLPSPDGYYYRPRPENNNNVQLLLIHYNGWPHRWDEWIRSDSERIRPFRTRTRHRVTGTTYGNGSNTSGISNYSLACPTPQAVFRASPSTAIRDEEDMVLERSGMMVELSRVVQGVNELLAVAAAHATPGLSSGVNTLPTVELSHLPWSTNLSTAGEMMNNEVGGGVGDSSRPRSPLDSAQLRQLAPLLDRLGRTLTDAAPHIAALADSLPRRDVPPINDSSITSPSHPTADEEADPFQLLAARTSHLQFGLGDTNAEENAVVVGPSVIHEETTSIMDPDLTDYINGMVNTTRNLGGASRGRNNSNRDTSTFVDQTGSASLLASYLASVGGNAAATGGDGSADSNRFGVGTHSIGNGNPRVIRMGGGNGDIRGLGLGGGPGIDIHIHAIVTGPGMGAFGGLGGLPFEHLGVGGTAPIASRQTNHNRAGTAAATGAAVASPTQNNDDADLFAELYSESPDPVNLHGENNSHGETVDRDGFDGSALGELFEDCLSIEEEASCATDDDASNGNTDVDNSVATDTEISAADAEKTENNDFMDANDDSDGSILALSEIESQGSIEFRQAASSTTDTNIGLVPSLTSFPLLQAEAVVDNDFVAPGPRRPSLGNRMFRRTLGRLSLTSRRSSERGNGRG